MVISRNEYLVILAVLAIERLFELVLSQRNANSLFARGARETGRDHFAPMVAFHSLFLMAPAAEMLIFDRPFPGPIGWVALGATIMAQALRYWAIFTLGERWNTRVLTVPNDAPITTGPYRFLRHPNYLAVAIEMVSVPCIHGCWLTAIGFSLGNAVLMSVRIPSEEQAQGVHYTDAFEKTPRMLPTPSSRSRRS